MPIFKINSKKLEPISEKKIVLECDIQKLIENNLDQVFGYEFITSEVKINEFRFDTLAWNQETKAFVIIEYKKDRNFSIVDQGWAYLSLLVNNQDSFLVEYIEKTGKSLSRASVDWSQSRVVFVAPEFTSYQLQSIHFKNMAFDLYEVKVFDNDLLSLEQIKPLSSSKSIDVIMENAKEAKIVKEIVNYDIDYHFKSGWTTAREMFDLINDKILALDPNIKQNITKSYIGYKINQNNVISIHGLKSGPSIEFPRSEPEDFNDPEKRVKYWKNSMQYYNQHISWFQLKSADDVDYAAMLIKQAYKRFKEKFN